MNEYTVVTDPSPVYVSPAPGNYEIVTSESPICLEANDIVYTVVLDNSDIRVQIADAIIRDVVEYIPEEDEVYDIEIDTSVVGVTYVGQALPGTAGSVASWRIKKISDTLTGSSVDWANGNADFVNVWDDHLSLTYGP